jgi:hypothetical protein
MPRLTSLVSLAVVLLAAGGCCRDTIREMASLKDGVASHSQARTATAKAAPQRQESRSATVVREDDDEAIETGSIKTPDCQGQHLAYQATKEYLKNFGPKPPDQPGELGPCNPNH